MISELSDVVMKDGEVVAVDLETYDPDLKKHGSGAILSKSLGCRLDAPVPLQGTGFSAGTGANSRRFIMRSRVRRQYDSMNAADVDGRRHTAWGTET